MRTVLVCLGLATAGFCVTSHWPIPPWVVGVLWVLGIALWVVAEWLERRGRNQ